MAAPRRDCIILAAILSLVICEAVEVDKKGYIAYCPCMGRFGNQADHFLGVLAFAKDLDRTLILPPWVEYHPHERKSVQVPFNTYFKVEALQAFHRVITMEEFMETLAPSIWPPGDRIAICSSNRGENTCNAKSGNPFGPFWDTFNIDFDKSEFFGPLYFDTHNAHTIQKWHERFPVTAFPVLAFTGAPASFPVVARNVPNHQYLVWSDHVQSQADLFFKQHIGKDPFVGVHLRNGSDFKNACSHVSDNHRHLFASPQCLGYNFEHGHVTNDLCYPPEATVISQINEAAGNIKAKTVFVATDDKQLINKLTKLLKPLKVVVQTEGSPHVDLALLAMSDHFIGNCVSSFTAFAARERRVKQRPTSFWAFPIPHHDEL